MVAYVIIGLRKERCRAKDPSSCRFHVGPDGSPLKHYKDAWSADKALKRLLKKAEALDPSPKTIEPPDGSTVTDFMHQVDDDPLMYTDGTEADDIEPYPWNSITDNEDEPEDIDSWDEHQEDGESPESRPLRKLSILDLFGHGTGTVGRDADTVGFDDDDLFTGKRRSRIEKAKQTQYDDGNSISAGTVQQLNRMRRDAGIRKASSQAAANLIMQVSACLMKHGLWTEELAWKESEDSPVVWPEWPSTREQEPIRALEQSRLVDAGEAICGDEGLNAKRVYLDTCNAMVSWSHDVLDDDGGLSPELVTYEAGFYDAVSSHSLSWDDLKLAGAVTCWLNANLVMRDGLDGSSRYRTVNVWCGRKPSKGLYVEGDEDVSCGKGYRSLDKMVDDFELMVAGMGQATVTLTVIAG